MPDFNPNHILHGSGGHAWWGSKKIATLQSVETKVTGDFEEINVCGDNTTYSIYNGYSGEGTFVYFKMDSDIIKQLSKAYQSGVMPSITITTSLEQKETNKIERVAYSDIVVTEFMLAKFEKKAKVEEEVPFKFGKFEILETI